jgi:hypothetical protein
MILGGLFCLASPVGPTWTFTPSESQRLVELGEKVVLKCEASGTPQPTISWAHNGQALLPTEHIKIESAGRFLFFIDELLFIACKSFTSAFRVSAFFVQGKI